MVTPSPDEKRPQLPPTPTPSTTPNNNNNNGERVQSSKPRSTGPLLLAVCAALAIIIASCYIVFSAAQPPPKLEDVLDPDCYALFESNERLRQLGFRNLTRPSYDCSMQLVSHLRSQATKSPPLLSRELQKLMVRTPLLEAALLASLVVTLALDLACTWGGLGGRYVVVDGLRKWTIRLLPLVYLVATAVPLYRNNYTVPSARLPAALLVGVSARVLVDILYQWLPRYRNYVGAGYVAAGVYVMGLSPVAGAKEMDLAFALTFALGGHVTNRLIESVSRRAEAEEKKELEEGNGMHKDALAC